MGPRNLSYSNSVLYSSVWTSVDTKRTSDYKSGFELRWAWAVSQECDSLDQKLKLEKKNKTWISFNTVHIPALGTFSFMINQ